MGVNHLFTFQSLLLFDLFHIVVLHLASYILHLALHIDTGKLVYAAFLLPATNILLLITAFGYYNPLFGYPAKTNAAELCVLIK